MDTASGPFYSSTLKFCLQSLLPHGHAKMSERDKVIFVHKECGITDSFRLLMLFDISCR